jgi:hypothetical protein
MTIAATGNFALTLQNLEILVASSAAFQREVGATGDAAAKLLAARARVYMPRHKFPDEESEIERPFAWIKWKTGWEGVGEDSGGNGFYHKMPLSLMLEKRISNELDEKDSEIDLLNWIGEVVADMESLAKTEGYLYVTAFVMEEYLVSDETENCKYGQAMFEVRVG